MKKNVLKSLACFMLLCMAWSCNDEGETTMSNPEAQARDFREKSENVWEGELGAEQEDGELVITASRSDLYEEFGRLLAKKGNMTKLSSLDIQIREADNDPSDNAYFLIASGTDLQTGMTTSIGVMLNKTSGFFYLGHPLTDGDPLDVTCRGCPSGCFLKYYVIGKARVPYCDSAGCGPDCDKQE